MCTVPPCVQKVQHALIQSVARCVLCCVVLCCVVRLHEWDYEGAFFVLSWDVLKGAGFLCGETAVSWDKGKGKSCVSIRRP